MNCGQNFEEIRPAYAEVPEEIYVRTTKPTMVCAMALWTTSTYNKFQRLVVEIYNIIKAKRERERAETDF